jgi:hypothetical protein
LADLDIKDPKSSPISRLLLALLNTGVKYTEAAACRAELACRKENWRQTKDAVAALICDPQLRCRLPLKSTARKLTNNSWPGARPYQQSNPQTPISGISWPRPTAGHRNQAIWGFKMRRRVFT